MTMVWGTDVHLNFLSPDQLELFLCKIESFRPDSLLLSGDIADGRSVASFVEMLASRLQIPVYFVLGNHDFYHDSIVRVRTRMTALTVENKNIRWLGALDPIPLDTTTALVGVDGWGDGRIGNASHSNVALNDWTRIEELAQHHCHFDVSSRLEQLQSLADRDAAVLKQRIEKALVRHSTILVATHVPPFEGACWHEGVLSNEHWLPWFTCEAVGDVLLDCATQNPSKTFRVYCGHTHSEGVHRPCENLTVYTGPAAYGLPTVQLLE